jgi:hypothetical protein
MLYTEYIYWRTNNLLQLMRNKIISGSAEDK